MEKEKDIETEDAISDHGKGEEQDTDQDDRMNLQAYLAIAVCIAGTCRSSMLTILGPCDPVHRLHQHIANAKHSVELYRSRPGSRSQLHLDHCVVDGMCVSHSDSWRPPVGYIWSTMVLNCSLGDRSLRSCGWSYGPEHQPDDREWHSFRHRRRLSGDVLRCSASMSAERPS